MREPDLVDFIDLAKDETLLVNDPPLLKVSNCEKPSKDSQ